MAPPPHVEDAVVKMIEVSAADIFVNDWKAFRKFPNLDQHLIQLIPEGEIETR